MKINEILTIPIRTKLAIFAALMRTDLKIFKKDILGKITDSLIWGFVSLIPAVFIFPLMGIQVLGIIQVPSIIISVTAFEIYGLLFATLIEILEKGHFYYLFTLPISARWIFTQKVLFYTIVNIILAFSMIPMCKIVLWNDLNLALISWGKFFIAIFVASLFFACCWLFIASLTKAIKNVQHVWTRIIFPLWFLGGFQFTWYTVLKMSKIIAYLSLFNPFTYVTEASRAAFFADQKFINFWLCILILFFGGIILAIFGYKNMKKRLELAGI